MHATHEPAGRPWIVYSGEVGVEGPLHLRPVVVNRGVALGARVIRSPRHQRRRRRLAAEGRVDAVPVDVPLLRHGHVRRRFARRRRVDDGLVEAAAGGLEQLVRAVGDQPVVPSRLERAGVVRVVVDHRVADHEAFEVYDGSRDACVVPVDELRQLRDVVPCVRADFTQFFLYIYLLSCHQFLLQ